MGVAGSLYSDCQEERGVLAALGTSLVCYLRRTWARLTFKARPYLAPRHAVLGVQKGWTRLGAERRGC